MSGKMCRPSGTWLMPRETIFSAESRWIGFPLKEDLAVFGRHNAADRHQGGGLAGAVGADQGDDLPFGHLDGNALQRLDVAVVGADIVQLKHRPPPRDRP